MPQRMSVKDRIARARALRAELPESTYRAKDIDALKREGRR
jgi:hypothetical protein